MSARPCDFHIQISTFLHKFIVITFWMSQNIAIITKVVSMLKSAVLYSKKCKDVKAWGTYIANGTVVKFM